MLAMLKKMIHDEAGQTTTEYGLLLGFLALATVGLITGMRSSLKGLFGSANSSLETANSGIT